jgi:serine/threonine protein kinase
MKEIKLEERELEKLKYNKNLSNIEKVISEIQIWKELDHTNIIRYYTSFIEKKNAYIVMELVEGINLAEYITNLKEKGLRAKEKDIIKILIDIVGVLKYLHKEKGILYKDLNPHNLMLDNNFNVKLCDFGLAKKLNSDDMNNDQSMDNAFVGSILYSSPESVKNQDYTEKSDIWSLGCIIYELLTFSHPFEGDNPLTVTKNIVELNYKNLNINDYENKVNI